MKSWLRNYTKQNKQQSQKQMEKTTIATSSNVTEGCGLQDLAKKETKDVSLYANLEELPIKIFYKLLQSPSNLNLLGQGNQQSNFDKLLDDYWQLVDANKYEQRLRKSTRFIKQENKITLFAALLMKCSLGVRCLEEFEQYNITSYDDLKRQINVLKTNYKIDVLKEQQKRSNKDVEFNIYRDKIILEKILSMSIDIDKCNVIEWVEYNKLAKEMSNERNKKN